MLKNSFLLVVIGLALTFLIAYFKTGFNQDGFSQALFVTSAVYVCVGALLFVTSAERKIIDDLGRKKGMTEQELKHIYRNVPTTQDSGFGWFDAFGGNQKFISSGKRSSMIMITIGIVALLVAFGLSGHLSYFRL